MTLDEKQPLDRAAAASRGQKFLRAMQTGGREAFERAFDEEFPPEDDTSDLLEQPAAPAQTTSAAVSSRPKGKQFDPETQALLRAVADNLNKNMVAEQPAAQPED